MVFLAFNSTYFYLIVCYKHMKMFLLYVRNISFIFIIIIIRDSIHFAGLKTVSMKGFKAKKN